MNKKGFIQSNYREYRLPFSDCWTPLQPTPPEETISTYEVECKKPKSCSFLENKKLVRKYRFTVEAESLPQEIVKSVNVELGTRDELIIELYNEELLTEIWIENFKNSRNKDIALVTYDGNGNEIFREIFKNSKIKSESYNFSYDDHEISTRKLTFVFEYRLQETLEKKKKGEIKVIATHGLNNPRIHYKLSIGYKPINKNISDKIVTDKFDLLEFKTPSLHIEDQESPFGKVCGKSYWMPVEIKINPTTYQKIMSTIENAKDIRFMIHSYDNKGMQLETWTLKSAFIHCAMYETEPCAYHANEYVILSIKYTDVEFRDFKSRNEYKI